MPATIYVLCALTSLACSGLLVRDYRRVRVRLLLWLSLAFVGLAINNVLLVADLVLFPEVDLSIWRCAAALAGLLVLIGGLIREEG
ncbi:MAG TPA: DUF5985 family protein [Planctomycetota bacterium]|nr:DUF5985 family protein [Planctomycetota bacterium]